jgi:hypothetical protein
LNGKILLCAPALSALPAAAPAATTGAGHEIQQTHPDAVVDAVLATISR